MAAATYDAALALVLQLEGGFVDDPRDPGGATKFGITRATLAEARGRPVTAADVKALEAAEAGAIYRARYWDALCADDLPAGLDLAVFDFAVNSGIGRSAKALQAVLRCRVDGRIGAATLAAAGACDVSAAIRDLTRARIAFLRALPTWPAFGRGWTSRVTRVEAAARAAVRQTLSPAKQNLSPAKKENEMDKTKTILASRTVWANLIGLASVGLGLVGVKTGSIDADGLADAAAQIVAGASFVASTVFRVTAKKQIGTPAG